MIMCFASLALLSPELWLGQQAEVVGFFQAMRSQAAPTPCIGAGSMPDLSWCFFPRLQRKRIHSLGLPADATRQRRFRVWPVITVLRLPTPPPSTPHETSIAGQGT